MNQTSKWYINNVDMCKIADEDQFIQINIYDF